MPDTLLPIPFSGHLWFLQYLFLISLLTLPLLLYLRSGSGQRWVTRLAGWCDRRGGIFLFVIPLALALVGLRGLFAADRSWADLVWYATFFVIGYVMSADRRFTEAIKKHGWVCLGLWLGAFYGGVDNEYFADAKVRVFGDGREVTGRVTRVASQRKLGCRRAWLELDGDVKRGDLAMWDLVPFRVRGDRLHARACDDDVGCAAILALIDELVRRGVRRKVLCVFAAAEEAGLQGAKYLCARRRIPKRTRVVAIETSRELPQARIGDGVVIRVGDRRSIFAPAMTAFMVDVARRIEADNEWFRYQRKLMDGGTCESSIYAAHGYTTGAVCLPLGHYHNRNFRTKRIAAEIVSVNDLVSMVELFVGMVEASDGLADFLKPTAPTYTEERRALGERLLH